MAMNKDEILADFQSITAIDDVGEAFSYLEESNWDLMAAVRRFLPQDDVSSDASTFTESKNDCQLGVPSTSSNFADLSSEAFLHSEVRLLKFNIHFNQQIYTIVIPANSTIENLKNEVFAITKVPIYRQAIHGWPPAKSNEAQKSTTVLSSLDLSDENELILTDVKETSCVMNDVSNNETIQTYTLNIVQQPEGKTIQLPCLGTKTILDVKTDIYTMTKIPVRHQEWSGWPPECTPSTTLAASGIELCHNFILKSIPDKEKPNTKTICLDTDSSDEFEDASDFNPDDDFFSDPPIQPRIKHLIPDQVDDLTLGTLYFIENYEQRYGEVHPDFYQGNLEDAIKDSCHKPALERKMLAIYLHHDQSVLTNVFCDLLLKCESVMQNLSEHFILYGWDQTFESNKNLFLSALSSCVGITAAVTVRNIPVDRLPALVIIAKNRSNCEVLSVIYGNVGVDDFLARLMEAIELYGGRIKVEVKEEKERAARAQVKYEQDMAYQQTLEADIAKEAAKKQKELELEAERQRIESEKAATEAAIEENRQLAERSLPQEPDDNEAVGITRVKVRAPGETLDRKFHLSNKLQDLLNFITSKGFPIDQYKVIATWPHRDLTDPALDRNMTLEKLKICPQETLIVEER